MFLQIINQYYTAYQALQLFCQVKKRWSLTLTNIYHNISYELLALPFLQFGAQDVTLGDYIVPKKIIEKSLLSDK